VSGAWILRAETNPLIRPSDTFSPCDEEKEYHATVQVQNVESLWDGEGSGVCGKCVGVDVVSRYNLMGLSAEAAGICLPCTNGEAVHGVTVAQERGVSMGELLEDTGVVELRNETLQL
jgi:hypothetical protein